MSPTMSSSPRAQPLVAQSVTSEDMHRHHEAIKEISACVREFYDRREPYRVSHGNTNSTRPKSIMRAVDISALRNVLSVDQVKRTVLVEPNVAMDSLVEATLPHGLVPPVVMEFPGITAGGGFAGTGGESSSCKQPLNTILTPSKRNVSYLQPGNHKNCSAAGVSTGYRHVVPLSSPNSHGSRGPLTANPKCCSQTWLLRRKRGKGRDGFGEWRDHYSQP